MRNDFPDEFESVSHWGMFHSKKSIPDLMKQFIGGNPYRNVREFYKTFDFRNSSNIS